MRSDFVIIIVIIFFIHAAVAVEGRKGKTMEIVLERLWD